ncbi:hypothetical protein CVT24_007071 [Panaeolus cyanescens]|uniref:Uncharacterized protein n=1 Tax=Panaeolus cyanescens TaxID=181874 RepID=A0A409VJS7_9AGAR|nr:hypothetical protein CVT24_007071 [Panaeolus cyanescens]
MPRDVTFHPVDVMHDGKDWPPVREGSVESDITLVEPMAKALKQPLKVKKTVSFAPEDEYLIFPDNEEGSAASDDEAMESGDTLENIPCPPSDVEEDAQDCEDTSKENDISAEPAPEMTVDVVIEANISTTTVKNETFTKA